MLTNLLVTLHRFSLSLLLGTLFFAAVSAPVIFRHLAPDRKAAGELVGKILRVMTGISWVTLGIMLLTAIGFQFLSEAANRWGWGRIGLIGLMIVLLAIYAFVLVPRMDVLADQATFDAQDESRERDTFNELHTWSTRLVGALFLSGVVLIGIEAFKG